MKKLRCCLILTFLSIVGLLNAQSREHTFSVSISSKTGESMAGETFTLIQTDYSLTYSKNETTLSSSGECIVKVYAGNHKIIVEKKGLKTYEESFTITGNCSKSIELGEDVKDPFAIKTLTLHNPFTGQNDVNLSWNKEDPAFFDDFESYDGFALNFGSWTGIDNDLLAAAPLLGSYPNRGSLQYATIINPLTVEPAWWYEYPVLRPFSGQQYVGFIRTSSGAINDDWLISPSIKVGSENVLQFMAKSGDAFKEKFEVGITTEENPTKDDFIIISSGNYETVGYQAWVAKIYDLSEYEGQNVKIAIHYISEANRGGAFMLMIDDIYIGQKEDSSPERTKRIKNRAEYLANVKYEIYNNGAKIGETVGNSFVIENLTEGEHSLGVKAIYTTATSNLVEIPVTISNSNCSKVTFEVKTNNDVSPDGYILNILDVESGETITGKISGETLVLNSLPNGEYIVNISPENFSSVEKKININGNAVIDIALKELIHNPYNITVDTEIEEAGDKYKASVKWNQDLGFLDSFDGYNDFAVGTFGEWKTIDVDKMPVYPISMGSVENIISFPGSGTQAKPTAIAPMVFNPYKTIPAMAPTDNAIMAPNGDKSIVFFSSMRAIADKWLISAPKTIRDGYVWKVTAKAYPSGYPEFIEFCVLNSQDDIASKIVVDKVQLSSDGWITYSIDLSAYIEQQICLGVHYVSNDAMLAQVDDFYVGPAEEGGAANVGKVLKYEVYLNGVLSGETTTSSYIFSNLNAGTYKVGIKAIYKSGESAIIEYQFNVASGVETATEDAIKIIGSKGCIKIFGIEESDTSVEIFNLMGQTITISQLDNNETIVPLPPGIYLVKIASRTYKIVVN
ncbi:MAG: choice-of-anchor J domain-containing protein [Muribaculaceae bacterium]